MIARLFAAAAIVIGCGFAGAQPAAATTDSETLVPRDLIATEAPPTASDGGTDGPRGDGEAVESADEPTASASPSPSPSPAPDELEPTPTEPADPGAEDVSEPPETAAPTETATDGAPDTGTASEPTGVVDPVAADPEPVPSPLPDSVASPEPIPSPTPEPAPAGDAAVTDPPIEPQPEPLPASPAPKPSPPPTLVDVAPSEDGRAEPGGMGEAAAVPTMLGSRIGAPATTTITASSTGQACDSNPSAGIAAPAASGEAAMTPTIPPMNPWSPMLAWSAREPDDTSGAADASPLSAIEHTAVTGAGLALVGQRVSSVSVAVDFARSSGGWAGPLVFNVWLRRQLRERRISQRHLGMLSGVNHSAISRLVNGHASPTLETATKLVHALRMEWTDDQIATYFDLLPERTLLPTQRVESALRGDGSLSDFEVHAIMQHYLVLRARRKRASSSAEDPRGRPVDLPQAAGES